MKYSILSRVGAVLLCSGMALAQSSNSSPAIPKTKGKVAPATGKALAAQQARRAFVRDVVQNAVALPQPDPQDRLRVLNTAASVIEPIDRKRALEFGKEGAQIEADLINSGQTPTVSMMSGGDVDCASATQFAERIPATAVVQAEQSLIGALTNCPKEAQTLVQRKFETGLNQGIVAPRGLLAVMERVGPKSAWSQANFEKMFSTLPQDAAANKAEAPNFAAMYERMAPELDKDVAKSTGLKLLVWLGKLPESGERTMAVNITDDSMKKVLGDQAFEEALSSDVMARQASQMTAGSQEIEHPAEENVSVLEAMGNSKTDQTDALRKMPPSLRARQAAAFGFATGTNGDPKMAERYFDIAYSALDEVWNNRAQANFDAPAVLEEVNEAAAQVNAVRALQRAQKLPDPSAQAISMLAVARVVSGQQ